WCRKEPQDFFHHPLALIRLEEELRVCRAIENQQLFGLRRPLILSENSRESRSGPAGIIPARYEQLSSFDFLGRQVPCDSSEDNKSIDLPRFSQHRGICSCTASHASPNHRHFLRARPPKIPDCCQHIELQRRSKRVLLTRASRLAIAAE